MNEYHGQTAPYHIKIDRLSNISMVGCRESSSVSKRNQSLQKEVSSHSLCGSLYLLPSKRITGDKAGQDIVTTNHSTSPNYEKLI